MNRGSYLLLALAGVFSTLLSVGTAQAFEFPANGTVDLRFSDLPGILHEEIPASFPEGKKVPPALGVSLQDGLLECRSGIVGKTLIAYRATPVFVDFGTSMPDSPECRLLKQLKISLPLPGNIFPDKAPLITSPAPSRDSLGGPWNILKLGVLLVGKWRTPIQPEASPVSFLDASEHPIGDYNGEQILAIPSFPGYRVTFGNGNVIEIVPLSGESVRMTGIGTTFSNGRRQSLQSYAFRGL